MSYMNSHARLHDRRTLQKHYELLVPLLIHRGHEGWTYHSISGAGFPPSALHVMLVGTPSTRDLMSPPSISTWFGGAEQKKERR